MSRALMMLAFMTAIGSASAGDVQDAPCVTGVVRLAPVASEVADGGGTLFVHLRDVSSRSGPPSAVITITSPSYPQSFSVCGDDQMIPAMPSDPLLGRYRVIARHSFSGKPMVEEGWTGRFDGEDGNGVAAGAVVEILVDEKLE